MRLDEDSVLEQIHELNLLQQQYITQKLKGISLNPKQARSINYIFANPGTIQKGLSNYLGAQDATVTNILKSLESKGLIRREIPLNNERQKCIYLTKDGERVAHKIRIFFSDLNGAAKEVLTADEQNEMSALLKKLSHALEKEVGK